MYDLVEIRFGHRILSNSELYQNTTKERKVMRLSRIQGVEGAETQGGDTKILKLSTTACRSVSSDMQTI